MTFDDSLRDCSSFGTVYKDSLHSACLRSRVATLLKISFGVDEYSTVKPLLVMFKRKGPFLLKNICVTSNILSYMHKHQLTFELEFPYIGGKQTPRRIPCNLQ